MATVASLHDLQYKTYADEVFSTAGTLPWHVCSAVGPYPLEQLPLQVDIPYCPHPTRHCGSHSAKSQKQAFRYKLFYRAEIQFVASPAASQPYLLFHN
jgi:hypothetical protein